MKTMDALFELGTSLRDEGKPRDSINVFIKILKEFPEDKAIHGVHTVLAGIHYNLREYDKALIHFKSATELKPKSELAALGLYLTYAALDRCDDAIHELIRYLNSYPADLFKDTLEELLEDLKDGYMVKYKDVITKFARQNGVEI